MTTKTEHDIATGKIIVRDMTADELAQYKKDTAKWANYSISVAEAQTAKAVARQAVLNKLGLTADEVAALFG